MICFSVPYVSSRLTSFQCTPIIAIIKWLINYFIFGCDSVFDAVFDAGFDAVFDAGFDAVFDARVDGYACGRFHMNTNQRS